MIPSLLSARPSDKATPPAPSDLSAPISGMGAETAADNPSLL
jgi:hypothetical protein